MKKLILILIICSIIIVGVTADVIVSNMTGTTTMDKQLRDFLLTKVSASLDAQGKPLPKEIKPAITIECLGNSCKYSAVQEGIIQSYDNVFDKGNMTTTEMETYVSNIVTQRLSAYASGDMNKQNYTKVSEGSLTIGEKK